VRRPGPVLTIPHYDNGTNLYSFSHADVNNDGKPDLALSIDGAVVTFLNQK
jgi:hypothetical protein